MIAATAVALVALVPVAVPTAQANDLKHKKHHVEKQIHHAHSDLDESSAQYRRATHALDRAQTRLGAAQAHLSKTQGQLTAAQILDRQMQARLDAAVQRLHDARAELADGRQQITQQADDLGNIAAQNYQTGSPQLMGLVAVLKGRDPGVLTSQLNSVDTLMDKESATLDRLEAAKTLLIVRERQVHAAEIDVRVKRQQAARELQRRQVLEAKAEKQKAQVADLVTQRASAAKDAERAKAHDLRQVKKLERQRDRLSAKLKRQAERARRRALRSSRVSGGSSGGSSGGYLSKPVDGYVTSPFGWRIHPIYGYRSLHDGVDFGAGCGQPLYAAASGRVMSEYYQTAWGNRLILNLGYHRGAGLAVIYNHLSRYAVHAGQYVHRGQVVGYVGTTGWSTGCHLHFTVMANGRAVDPMGWL